MLSVKYATCISVQIRGDNLTKTSPLKIVVFCHYPKFQQLKLSVIMSDMSTTDNSANKQQNPTLSIIEKWGLCIHRVCPSFDKDVEQFNLGKEIIYTKI